MAGSRLVSIVMAVAVSLASAPLARAQGGVEIGASLVNGTVGLGDASVSTIGIPSGGLALLSPGVYASVFLGRQVAVEPQLGLVWASFDGDSAYLLNVLGQVDYFVRGTDRPSPYVFGAAGVISQTDADYTPKSFGIGAGYRMLAGDRLTFRFDGRYTHFTGQFEGDDGDALIFTLSIGGVLGR